MVLAALLIPFLVLVPSIPFARTLPPDSMPPWCHNSYPPSVSCPIVGEETTYHGYGSITYTLVGVGYSFWSGKVREEVLHNAPNIVGFLKVNQYYKLSIYDGSIVVASFVVNPSYKGRDPGRITIDVATSIQPTKNLSIIGFSMTIQGRNTQVSSSVASWGNDSPLVSLTKSSTPDGRGETFTVNNWYEIRSGFVGLVFNTTSGNQKEGVVFTLHLEIDQDGHLTTADRVLDIPLDSNR